LYVRKCVCFLIYLFVSTILFFWRCHRKLRPVFTLLKSFIMTREKKETQSHRACNYHLPAHFLRVYRSWTFHLNVHGVLYRGEDFNTKFEVAESFFHLEIVILPNPWLREIRRKFELAYLHIPRMFLSIVLMHRNSVLFDGSQFYDINMMPDMYSQTVEWIEMILQVDHDVGPNEGSHHTRKTDYFLYTR